MLKKIFFLLFIYFVIYGLGNNIIINIDLITNENKLKKSPITISKMEEIRAYNYSGKGITLYLPYINFYSDLNNRITSINFNLNDFLAMTNTKLPFLTENRLKYELINFEIMEIEEKVKLLYQAITNKKILKNIENIYNEVEKLFKNNDIKIPKKQIYNIDLLLKQLELKRKKHYHQKEILEMQLRNTFFINKKDNIILDTKDYKENIHNFDKNKFLKEEYLYNLPEAKVQLYKLKENNAEKVANFYRNILPRISPYIIINNFSNIETGVMVNYSLNSFITMSIKGSLFYDFNKYKNLNSNISFNITLNSSEKYQDFNISYLYNEEQIINNVRLNITNIVYTIEQLEMELNIAKEYLNLLENDKNYDNSPIEYLKYVLDKISYIEYYYSLLNEYNYNIFRLEIREKFK
ncbi:hypothetical protein X275_09125 [Marinitoga sp. 1197]|nr:hypothetical protein X275_09125 [Marinitoga sp. 1197]